jgi:hypothetical protein
MGPPLLSTASQYVVPETTDMALTRILAHRPDETEDLEPEVRSIPG